MWSHAVVGAVCSDVVCNALWITVSRPVAWNLVPSKVVQYEHLRMSAPPASEKRFCSQSQGCSSQCLVRFVCIAFCVCPQCDLRRVIQNHIYYVGHTLCRLLPYRQVLNKKGKILGAFSTVVMNFEGLLLCWAYSHNLGRKNWLGSQKACARCSVMTWQASHRTVHWSILSLSEIDTCLLILVKIAFLSFLHCTTSHKIAFLAGGCMSAMWARFTYENCSKTEHTVILICTLDVHFQSLVFH